jgi:topoisomerase-4 subunit B
LGEISPEEFATFIGDDMRVSPVIVNDDNKIKGLLEYYMGKNTMERQEFIIGNLRVEKDTDDVLVEMEEETA